VIQIMDIIKKAGIELLGLMTQPKEAKENKK